MKSLRLILDLLLQLLGIRTRTTRTSSAAPVFGPAGPWLRAHVAALPIFRTPRAASPQRRPAPVRAPPHILAMLEAAPDVEPDLLRKGAPARATSHPTVLAPPELLPLESEPPRARRRRHAPRTWIAGITLRASRGCRAVAEWLVFDSPPDGEEAYMRGRPLTTA